MKYHVTFTSLGLIVGSQVVPTMFGAHQDAQVLVFWPPFARSLSKARGSPHASLGTTPTARANNARVARNPPTVAPQRHVRACLHDVERNRHRA